MGSKIRTFWISDETQQAMTLMTTRHGKKVSRSDICGAAISMVYDHPEVLRRTTEFGEFKEIGLALCDQLGLELLKTSLEKGKTNADIIIEDGGVCVSVPAGSPTRFIPPMTFVISPSPDFKVHVDLRPGLVVTLYDLKERVAVSDVKSSGIGRQYRIKMCWLQK